MTREPGLIILRFEVVIVQNPPAWPWNCEHSLVRWRGPDRGEAEAEAGASPVNANTPARMPVMMMLRMRFMTCPLRGGDRCGTCQLPSESVSGTTQVKALVCLT